jgi:1-deoxy-D-xylulose-5-phosphate reductoisomerase
MSAANEIAVAAFLSKQIAFMQIPETIRATMDAHNTLPATSLEAILESDDWARLQAKSTIEGNGAVRAFG